MSDGNINRNILPYTQYQSGLRAGQSRMKSLLLETTELTLKNYEGQLLSSDLIQSIRKEIASKISI